MERKKYLSGFNGYTVYNPAVRGVDRHAERYHVVFEGHTVCTRCCGMQSKSGRRNVQRAHIYSWWQRRARTPLSRLHQGTQASVQHRNRARRRLVWRFRCGAWFDCFGLWRGRVESTSLDNGYEPSINYQMRGVRTRSSGCLVANHTVIDNKLTVRVCTQNGNEHGLT